LADLTAPVTFAERSIWAEIYSPNYLAIKIAKALATLARVVARTVETHDVANGRLDRRHLMPSPKKKKAALKRRPFTWLHRMILE
jgi:hypothetical protein